MAESIEDMKVQLDILQDEVDLIKNQIKQNLVDLREYIMNRDTIFPVTQCDTDKPISNGRDRSIPIQEQTGQELNYLLENHWLDQSEGDPLLKYSEVVKMPKSSGWDTSMVGSMIWWLGTIRRRGLSLRQFAQFLEAYETSGLLDHSTIRLVKVMIRAMEDALCADPDDEHIGTAEEYAEGLLQFSEIFCRSTSEDHVVQMKGSWSPDWKPGHGQNQGAYSRYA